MLAELLRWSSRGSSLALSALLLVSSGAAGQEREVVSKQIAVGRSEASLRLEFESGEPIEVSLREGVFWVDGSELGASSASLEAAWRSLLGQAVALEDGPLARALVDWSPPGELDGAALQTASRIDEALERGLRVQPEMAVPAADPASRRSRERSVIAALLGRRERLVALAEALEDVRLADVQLHVAEEITVQEGVELDGTVVIVDGNLEVRGEVDGDVVVVGGTVRLHPGGRITGDVKLADARLYEDGGEIEGEVVELDEDDFLDLDDRERLRNQIEREMRELRAERSAESSGFFAPVRHIVGGLAGVISTLLTVIVLGVVGGAILHFAGNSLEVVAETARRAPARAAMVGLAGTFLAIPVWLLGTVALAISIIGIPVMLFWLPLFPIAVVLGAGLGYYAVAHNVGAWIARHRYPYLGWVRVSNPYTLLIGGVFGLMAAFVVANVAQIGGPWLGFLEGLFVAVGVIATLIAVLVGFGAVLITRAGRRPEYYPGGHMFDDGWDDDFGPSGTAGGSSWAPSGSSGGAGGDAPAGDAAAPDSEEKASSPTAQDPKEG